ncbi:MAG: ABC transporter permease [Bifidobacterium sp.]|jgi:putative ABC transport system permease protein|nr:ABC transporter permease [Bifidobacterium sp.]MCH4174895.1 ABC transporter permease [Bifidobacterium sp.]
MENNSAQKNSHKTRRSNVVVKDIWRTSLANWKRFLSIALITMLGVAVLTGIYAGCKDTLLSADRFYDAQHLYDIQVVSSAGLTDEDLKALSGVEGVQSVQGEHTSTASVQVDHTEHLATIQELGSNGLNQVSVQQGALPTGKNDVAATKRFIVDSGARLGDKVNLTTSNAVTGQSTAAEYTITAVVLDPTDIANPEGYSTGAFRSQESNSYDFFVPSGSNDTAVYSAISIAVSGAQELDTFSDEYAAKVQKVIDRIDSTVTQHREEARQEQLQQLQLQQANKAQGSESSGSSNASSDANDTAVQWHIQDRASIATYSNLKGDLSSIESIGRAFPVVFLVVAILMSLTAMTRMVEEDRGLIGTYLGLGYGRISIASRYVIFALTACTLGGVLGNVLGFIGIPAFLMKVLDGLYIIENTTFFFDSIYGIGGFALFAVGVVGATMLACKGEMSQMPARLMRPKSPKVGSRVLLERWTWLWNRMSFLNKVTVRNLFRFKSRLLMTVGGVAGCTALIVCGFAINDTVQTLGAKQYGGVDRYDLLSVAVSDDAAASMRQKLVNDGLVKQSVQLRVEGADLLNVAGESESVRLIVVPDGQDISSMVDFRPAATGLSRTFGFSTTPSKRPRLTLGTSGLLVAQSAANSMGVSDGDTVSLRSDVHGQHSVKVQDVYRNLIGSDIFMSASLYESVFGVNEQDFATNAVMATLKGSDDAQITYAENLKKSSSVASANSTISMQRSFAFDLMSAVVTLIVALAGALALVVLFTLSSTNVSERIREMATLKVLGFTDREVHVYVNKEMLLLAFFGTLLGLPLGRVIGGMLTGVLNMSGMFFEVEVHWTSYVISAVATMFFALVVQLFTNVVLDRIDPVSSLKSVE